MDKVSVKVTDKVAEDKAKRLSPLLIMKAEDIIKQSENGLLIYEFLPGIEDSIRNEHNNLTTYDETKIEFYVLIAEYNFLKIPYEVFINNDRIEMDLDDIRLWVMNRETDLKEIQTYEKEMEELDRAW